MRSICVNDRVHCPRRCPAVAAVGIANFVRGNWIKPAEVIDAGYNDGNIGDVAVLKIVRRND